LIIDFIDEPDISSEGSTLFNPDPLMSGKLEILGFVRLIDVRHFFLRHEHVLLEDEMESRTSRFHVDFLKSLDINPAFS
jgi:hypothetical protein